MSISNTEECKILCLQQKEDGCCFLKNRFGCYWIKDAIAYKIAYIERTEYYTSISPGLSITCNNVGSLQQTHSN